MSMLILKNMTNSLDWHLDSEEVLTLFLNMSIARKLTNISDEDFLSACKVVCNMGKNDFIKVEDIRQLGEFYPGSLVEVGMSPILLLDKAQKGAVNPRWYITLFNQFLVNRFDTGGDLI